MADKVIKSLAKEYPEFIGINKNTGEKCFNMAALMRKKGYIKQRR